MAGRFPFPIPNGWFPVAWSDAVAPGAALRLRCPFHGWGFDADGRCVDVPYAKRIPSSARPRAWTTRGQGLPRAPALCDGDGPIATLRRWGRQFYGAPAAG